ncbi:MAG: hypothetical protein IJN54_14870 [Lachnospiraceae bacterium]|nr:hypothetical protein [Lachnospiraceae bacterium]
MSTQEKKSTIESVRTAEGFLPEYSDFYFERKKQPSFFKYILSYLFIIFLICLIDIDYNNKKSPGFLTIIGIAVLLYQLFIKKHIIDHKKLYGAKLEYHGIVKVSAYGEQPPVSYQEIEQAVAAGDFRYEDTGLRIGSGTQKLLFHYEIGDSIAQKHVEECYALLQKHLNIKLPPFEKKGLDLLDRKYFYEKKCKTHTISLICALIIFFIYYSASVRHISNMYFLASLFCPWECFSLYCLSKNGKLAVRNRMLLQKAFQDYPQVRFGWQYAGYAHFLITALLLILGNYFIISFF